MRYCCFLKPDSAVKAALGFGLIGAAAQGLPKAVNIDIADIRAIGPMNKSGFEILTKENETIKGAFAKGVGLLTVYGQVANGEDAKAREMLLEYVSAKL